MNKFNSKAFNRILNTKPTKRQIKARATLLGCEIRYSGKLGQGFVHRFVRYKPEQR